MKRRTDSLLGWISLLRWQIDSARWPLLIASVVMVVTLPTAYVWKKQAAALDLEQQRVVAKAKRSSASSNRTKPPEKSPDRAANKAKSEAKSNLATPELALKLPSFQKVKAAPLADYLSDSKVRGLQIKQVDYVWSKVNTPPTADQRIGRLDVNLSLTGSYTAIRRWLGELLLEAPHLQISVLQMQRVSRDSPLVSTAITLAVFYEDGK